MTANRLWGTKLMECFHNVEADCTEGCKGRFPLPELTARVDGCQKMHPSSRAVNSARELGP